MTEHGMVSISALRAQSATLSLDGPIDARVAEEFSRCVRIVREDYKYDDITLEINSPGGSFVPLRQVLREMRSVKAAGVTLRTHAQSLAASAAAIVLSFGSAGCRCVDPDATLLFHSGRLLPGSGVVLTAASVRIAQETIGRTDRWLFDELLAELAAEAGGQAGLLAQVARRSGALLASDDLLSKQSVMSAACRRAARRYLRGLAEIDSENPGTPAKTYMSAVRWVFGQDGPIEPSMARALGLIDRIDQVGTELADGEPCVAGRPPGHATKSPFLSN